MYRTAYQSASKVETKNQPQKPASPQTPVPPFRAHGPFRNPYFTLFAYSPTMDCVASKKAHLFSKEPQCFAENVKSSCQPFFRAHGPFIIPRFNIDQPTALDIFFGLA
ncbi:hypothetical protein L596_000310 [Steinernema carpocapsae]|uniref:Uncharacterized protein n=1 Tax=Steinernema carpocapsae TaxID=34508 RepID=A0A4U8UHM4_STECR|nr:hypothetical protein L596_000310 [Steinernema carpocapsae]